MDESGKSQGGTKGVSESSPPLEQLLAEIEAKTLKPDSSVIDEAAGKRPDTEGLSYGAEQYIRFALDEVHFAVPLKSSLEVGRLPGITPLPYLPSWVSGISNIRGEVVSIVDLKGFFGRGLSSGKSGQNMILLHNSTMKVGFRVDRLMGILSLAGEKSRVMSNPFTEGDITPYLSGVIATDRALLYLLDVEKLLTSKEMNAFRKI